MKNINNNTLLFILKGAAIEQGSSTPLMEAAQEGHVELVRFLLEQGILPFKLIKLYYNGHSKSVISLSSIRKNVKITTMV